jgi:hypothetical protein
VRYSITGIDPGLVHTGVVTLEILTEKHKFLVRSEAVASTLLTDKSVDVERTALLVAALTNVYSTHIFIEKYQPRSHFGTDAKMMELVRAIHMKCRDSQVISNTGSKQVIKPALLELLHLKKFPATHHQDLQAAARILLYGALKDEELNRVLFTIIHDNVTGNPWEFQ